MKLSYEGIGQYTATFACENVKEGDVVKISGSGTVEACEAGDRFCGQVIACDKSGKTCSVVLGGLATVSYNDEMFPGWNFISADGEGGIQEDTDGWEYLVVNVDEAAKTAAIAL